MPAPRYIQSRAPAGYHYRRRSLGRLGSVIPEPQGFDITTNADGSATGAMPPPPPKTGLQSSWVTWGIVALGAYFLFAKK